LKAAGVNVALAEYPGAYHTYDNFLRKGEHEPAFLPQNQSGRNCQLAEGERGVILNVKTGKPFDLNDPCYEKGAHVAYNEAATTATEKAVKEFLATVFKLKSQVP
jgi:hypothetical protein